MLHHDCYLLASYLELPDRSMHQYVSSGGFKSFCAFHVTELSSSTDVKHADVVKYAKVSAFTEYVSLNCLNFTYTHRTSPKCTQIGGESCSR